MTKGHRRLTSRERATRIFNRIDKAGDKGISVKQLAWYERLSRGRVQHHLRQLGKRKSKDRVVDRLGERYYRIHPLTVETKEKKPKPLKPLKLPEVKLEEEEAEPVSSFGLWRPLLPEGAKVELRGYFNYTSPRPGNDIDIDCVMVVANSEVAILRGSKYITSIVQARLGRKLASMLKFGVSEALPLSSNQFLFRRRGGSWLELNHDHA